MKKSDVLELLRDEPEELDIGKFIYTLWFRRKIDLALASPEENDVPHEDVMRELDEWLKGEARTMASRRDR